MNTLTHRQKLQIFFSYFGCKYTYTSESAGDFTCEVSGLNLAISSHVSQGAILLLTPLSAITDEDAIEVAKMVYHKIVSPNIELGHLILNRVFDTSGEYEVFYKETIFILQYLLQRGYAVPLFIAPNHPNNGKTAIELGIAIDKTTL